MANEVYGGVITNKKFKEPSLGRATHCSLTESKLKT